MVLNFIIASTSVLKNPESSPAARERFAKGKMYAVGRGEVSIFVISHYISNTAHQETHYVKFSFFISISMTLNSKQFFIL